MSSLAATRDSGDGFRQSARRLSFGTAILAGGLLFGLFAGEEVASGHTGQMFLLAVVVVPVLLWKRPVAGPLLLLTSALLIEQFGQTVVAASNQQPGDGSVSLAPPAPLTWHIHLYNGIGSLHVEPIDLLVFGVAMIYLARTRPGTRNWPRSQVSRGMLAVLGCVLFGLVMGIVRHHGTLRVALMETRPYVYLSATFFLTAALVRNRSALRAVLWAFVIGTGLKALQGVFIFLQVANWHPRPEAVLGHEEAYTLGIYIILVAALWLFQVKGTLRKTATWILPLVIAADLANNRRAAWLDLGGGLIVLAVIGYCALPHRRRALNRAGLVLLAFLAVYLPAYWNKTGGLAQPARAIHSQLSPDPRDAASNLYRLQENANLKLNIHQGGVLGSGFGVPIDYALPIVDISKIDANIKYVPHNGVLYILMRMGLLGMIAFWGLLGAGIIAACRLARVADRELAVIGAFVACALIAYALEGSVDQGFFFYRIALVMGTLLGLAEAARRIDRARLDPGSSIQPQNGAPPGRRLRPLWTHRRRGACPPTRRLPVWTKDRRFSRPGAEPAQVPTSPNRFSGEGMR